MIKWGIIGVGDVCEKKSGPGFQKADGSELVAVMRRTGSMAEDFAKRHGVPKWYNDAEKLINDPEVNAIYIATPPNGHEKLTLLAAASGKPIYVEKPMAKSHEECLNMIKTCEKANVPLFVAYYRRALPNFLKIKDLVDGGAIGDIRFVDIKIHKFEKESSEPSWRTDPEVGGAGHFYDLASHQLDFLDFLLGPIKNANGIAKNLGGFYAAEDTTLGTFEFEKGALGIGSWCFVASKESELEKTTIYGSKGRIEFPFFDGSEVDLYMDGHLKQSFNFDMPEHIQQPLIQTIVDELNGKQTKCVSTGVSAARTNWAMEQICKRID